MPRTLVVDARTYCWTRANGHIPGPNGRVCTERVSVWLAEHRARGVTIRFIDGGGGATTQGGGWGGHDGGVLLGDVAVNLNRPVVIAALVRAAIARGWDGATAACELDDGFAVLREAARWLPG